MTPAERIPLLLRLTDAVATLGDVRTVALYLGEFGFPMSGDELLYGVFSESVQSVLQRGTDEQLIGLAEFLFGDRTPIDGDLVGWRSGEFKLFLSHISQHKEFVVELANALKLYGVHGFVAHEDIDPGQEWVKVIDAALMTCDALVAVLHLGFHESKWTDQEVGYAIGRRKFTVAIRAGIDPYGFLSPVQGISGHQDRDVKEIAHEIVKVLTSELKTKYAMRDALVDRLVRSTSYPMSIELVDLLMQCPKLTKDQYFRLRDAERKNVQVGKCYTVPWLLDPLSEEYDSQ